MKRFGFERRSCTRDLAMLAVSGFFGIAAIRLDCAVLPSSWSAKSAPRRRGGEPVLRQHQHYEEQPGSDLRSSRAVQRDADRAG
jgi:hypothetical protein